MNATVSEAHRQTDAQTKLVGPLIRLSEEEGLKLDATSITDRCFRFQSFQ